VRAIDSTVLVRFLADEDPKQSPKARAVVAAEFRGHRIDRKCLFETLPFRTPFV
jgi:hypothetical protein